MRCDVTLRLIGWIHTQNDTCIYIYMHFIVNMLSHVIHYQHTRPQTQISLFGLFLLAEISWLDIEIMLSINNRIQTKLVGLIILLCRLVLSILHVVCGGWMWNYVLCKPISVIPYPCRDLTVWVKEASGQRPHRNLIWPNMVVLMKHSTCTITSFITWREHCYRL